MHWRNLQRQGSRPKRRTESSWMAHPFVCPERVRVTDRYPVRPVLDADERRARGVEALAWPPYPRHPARSDRSTAGSLLRCSRERAMLIVCRDERRRKLAGQRSEVELQSPSSFELHNTSSIWKELWGSGDRAKLIKGDLSCGFAIVSKAPPGLSSPTGTVEGRRCRANATRGRIATDGARAHHLRSRPPRLWSPAPAVTRPRSVMHKHRRGGTRARAPPMSVTKMRTHGAVIWSAASTPSSGTMNALLAGGQGPPAI